MKKILSKIILFLSILSVIALLITGYAVRLNPNSWAWLALAGYGFPMALAMTVGMLMICALMRKRLLIIPFAGLLLAYQPVTTYCPLHKETKDVPQEAFSFMSYNSYNWGRGDFNKAERDSFHVQFFDYLNKHKTDIICLQEANTNKLQNKIDSILPPDVYHCDTVRGKGGSVVTIISRFPIIRKQLIKYETQGNNSAAFWLNIKGREVIVINNHLQTMGFSMQERRNFGDMMIGERREKDYIKSTSRTIIGKILEASKVRSHQADSIAAFIRRHAGTPIIICGDFNDIPQSYTYHTITNPGKGANGNDVEITDCYRTTALGPGYSYGHFGMRVRIDNILCSQELTPYNAKVDGTTDCSDHYPISCKFTLN